MQNVPGAASFSMYFSTSSVWSVRPVMLTVPHWHLFLGSGSACTTPVQSFLEFDFHVEAGSMQPKNDAVRRQTAVTMGQTLAPFLDMGVVDPRAVAEHLIREGFGIKDASKSILPPPEEEDAGPDEKLVTTMAYKDAPPDIQRQIEAQAGLQPSAYGALPVEAAKPDPAPAPAGPPPSK